MKAAAVLVIIAFLAGCGSMGAVTQPIQPIGDGPYRLDSGDRLQLTVFGQPDLSGEFIVRDDGAVSIPLLGAVPARDLTAEQLAGAVANRLADGLLVDPDVTVQVLEYRPFFVLGEVVQPGEYPYQPRLTVLAGVAIAGGFTIPRGSGRDHHHPHRPERHFPRLGHRPHRDRAGRRHSCRRALLLSRRTAAGRWFDPGNATAGLCRGPDWPALVLLTCAGVSPAQEVARRGPVSLDRPATEFDPIGMPIPQLPSVPRIAHRRRLRHQPVRRAGQ